MEVSGVDEDAGSAGAGSLAPASCPVRDNRTVLVPPPPVPANPQPLCAGSFFSGIGGFDLALQRSGWGVAYQSEIEPYCTRLLAQRFPGVPNLGDITAIDPAALPDVDLICGGFPCQGMSVAGLRAGLEDARSALFFELARIIAAKRPQWLLIENVPGLLSSQQGRDFRTVLDTLAQLGYGLAWRVLDSRYFGVPQRRRRVYLVGCLGDAARAAEVLFEPQGRGGHPAPGLQAWQEVARTLTGGAAGTRSHGKPSGSNEINLVVAATLNSGGNSGGFRTEPGEHLVVSQPPCLRSSVVAATLTAPSSPRYDGERETFIVSSLDVRAHTLTAEGFDASEDGTGRGTPLTVSPVGVRRLTPVECERLQGFPDGWTAPDGVTSPPDSPRYRALGNAVTVNVVQWILRRLTVIATARRG